MPTHDLQIVILEETKKQSEVLFGLLLGYTVNSEVIKVTIDTTLLSTYLVFFFSSSRNSTDLRNVITNIMMNSEVLQAGVHDVFRGLRRPVQRLCMNMQLPHDIGVNARTKENFQLGPVLFHTVAE